MHLQSQTLNPKRMTQNTQSSGSKKDTSRRVQASSNENTDSKNVDYASRAPEQKT